jgi:hypothetical protein
VLAIARTRTAANRLIDVLTVFDNDQRVDVWFTVIAGSAFADGLDAALRAAGQRVVAWEQALRTEFQLAISASDKGDLQLIDAPLVMVSHGVGYHRYSIPPNPDAPTEISGMSSTALGHARTVVVAHPAQLRTLRRVSPAAADRALVVSDPCLDRMLASRRLADHYREALDPRDRQLVLLSSTWGEQSLLGRHIDLPARLLAELPTDQYQVAIALHPNVWARHGAERLRSWLRLALDAGLLLIPPEEGWRAALIAARAVIADHGSVLCYAAALGKPLLMAADGGPEVVPESPMDLLRRQVPRLRPDRPLRAQLEQAMHDHDSDRHTAITSTIFTEPGQSSVQLRDALYGLMRLDPPAHRARVRPLPVPTIDRQEPTAFTVHTRISPSTHPIVVRIARYPSILDDLDPPADGAGPRHLLIHHTEPDERLTQSAAVIFRTKIGPGRTWAAETLARYPGCRIAGCALAADRLLIRLRDGLDLHAAIIAGPPSADLALCAAAVYGCFTAGKDLRELSRLTIEAGTSNVTISLAVTSIGEQPGP